MYLSIEKGMGRNISYIVKRFRKGNNKYMDINIIWRVNKPSKFILSLDVNKLNGWVISKYLPHDGFKWLNQKVINRFYVNSIGENSYGGYILEVDLEYPDELHKLHYPLAPEKT